MEPVYTSVVAAARSLFAAQGTKFVILGEEHVPTHGGAVMAINHTSYFDFMYAGLAAVRSRRLVRFMAKKSIWSHRVAGPLMRAMHHIAVDRQDGAPSYATAVSALRAGEIVGVFPEATMSVSFELKQFKSGAVRMALDAGVPILPTTIWGAQRQWTKDLPKQLGRRRIPVHITVGEPLVAQPGEDARALTERLRAAMLDQLARQQADYPALGPDQAAYLPVRLGGTAPTPDQALAKEEHDRTRTTDKFNS